MIVFEVFAFLLLAVVTTRLWIYTLQWCRLIRLSLKTDGPSLWSILSYIPKLRNRPLDAIREMTSAYGYKMFRLFVGSEMIFVVADPDAAAAVMKGSQLTDKPKWYYQCIDYYIPKNFFTSNGGDWSRGRKLVDPVFHKQALHSYLPSFNKSAQNIVEMLRQYCPGKSFAMNTVAEEVLVKTSMKTIYGEHVSPKDQDRICKVITTAKHYIHLQSLSPPVFLYEKLRGAPRNCKRNLRDAIAEYKNKVITKINLMRDTLQSGKTITKPCAGIERMVMRNGVYAENSPVTNEQLFNEALFVATAAYDTTATLITATLAMLALHPETQREVREEIDSIFGGSDRPATIEDLRRMQQLDRVIKETLRLYPPVPTIAREAKQDVDVNGAVIPKGGIMVLNIKELHRNPNIYEHPNRFDPDRFLPENDVKIPSAAYLPFSFGSRNCVGRQYALLNVKTVASYILRNYEVRPGDDFTFDDVQVELKLTAYFVKDIVLRVHPLETPSKDI